MVDGLRVDALLVQQSAHLGICLLGPDVVAEVSLQDAIVVVRRREAFRPAAVAFVVSWIAVLAFGLAVDRAGATFALLGLIGAAQTGACLMFPALASRVFPEGLRGGGVGWTLAFGRVGSIVGPALGGWLLQRGLSPPSLFALVSLPALGAALGVWRAWRGQRRIEPGV